MLEYYSMPRRRAFTLVELLVVIAIIGLLSTIAVVSLSSARSKARNTKRGADLKQLTTIMQLIYDQTGIFPASNATVADTWACVSKNCRDGWATIGSYNALDTAILNYISSKPDDPIGGNRGYAGYLYNGGFPGGTGATTIVFPSAPTLNYLLEPPATTCPVGLPWSTTGSYTQCYISLN